MHKHPFHPWADAGERLVGDGAQVGGVILHGVLRGEHDGVIARSAGA